MCSITHLPMQHPVTAADGHTYEKSAIVHWLAHTANVGSAVISDFEAHWTIWDGVGEAT